MPRPSPNESFTINRSSPQARELVGWWVPMRGGGARVTPNLAGRMAGMDVVWNSTAAHPVSHDVRQGAVWHTVASANNYGLIPASILPANNWSLQTIVRLEALGAWQSLMCRHGEWWPWFGIESSEISFGLNAGGQWPSSNVPTTAIQAAANWLVVTGVFSATTIQIFVNGAAGPATAHGGAWSSGAQPLKLMGDNAGQGFGGRMAEFRIYQRALTRADHLALLNPRTRWDLYATAPRRVVYSFPAPAFRAAWAARANRLIGGGW